MNGHTRLRRRHGIHACYLSLFTLLLVRQYLVVCIEADEALDDGENENESAYHDAIETSQFNQLSKQVDHGDAFPTDESSPLSATLAQAANAGAQIIRESDTSQENKETATILDDEHLEHGTLNSSDSNNNKEYAINPKINTRCHWGKRGCKRGQANTSSSVQSQRNSTESVASHEDGNSAISSPALSSSSFAGSATAKIKERIMRDNSSSSTIDRRKTVPNNSPVWTTHDDSKFRQQGGRGSVQKPPQGFKLAGRIVTSSSDGLSYFLDSPSVTSEGDNAIADDSMLTIPYVYLECGPSIESTTEAFPVMDMVLRHFPASATMGHWINLAGRVTLEKDDDARDGEGSGYIIDTNGKNEGQPKLLIALSPIQITVSGNDEESRLFNPGDVLLMEDTLGKGHKMNAAPVSRDDEHISQAMNTPHGQDMIVLMVSLPHTVHFPIHNWLDESSDDESQEENHDVLQSQPSVVESASNEDDLAPSGFAPKNLHRNRQQRHKRSSNVFRSKKPCPLEYDSAYSSLFMPTYHHSHHYRRSWRTRRLLSQGGRIQKKRSTSMPAFDAAKYPPPPGFSTYDQDSLLVEYLPSLRRTMLVGLGLSLTSSIVYFAQLLYPPLLALWGGATVIIGGAFVNVLFTRWSYRRFIADWEEEWRWKREATKSRMHREMNSLTQQKEQRESGIDSDTQNGKKGIESKDAVI